MLIHLCCSSIRCDRVVLCLCRVCCVVLYCVGCVGWQRDFIDKALYDPVDGYFNRPHIIQLPSEPIAFNTLSHYGEYLETLAKMQKRVAGSWFTPVEIFQPYYAEGIAKWMMQCREHRKTPPDTPLVIYEMGAGTGTD